MQSANVILMQIPKIHIQKIPHLPQTKLVLDLANPEGCKA